MSTKLGLADRLRGRGLNKHKLFLIMEKYGRLGVSALKENTPTETGETAEHWDYKVTNDLRLTFTNAEVTVYGVPIPKLLMYGYKRGRHFINGDDFVRRTLNPIIDSLKEEIRKEML